MASIDPMLLFFFLLYIQVSTTEHPEFTYSSVNLVEEHTYSYTSSLSVNDNVYDDEEQAQQSRALASCLASLGILCHSCTHQW